ncbi:unnamed protein product [Adineta ricciae]|uniref:PiggyBac transposable element-derived protein 4-like protein n=1 Tax=Adineta ricciae TaxID=249248 RepID=A0A815PAB5_ADIRI|nr:unnamed protein product [Adineta ricciae]CAF1486695.1 unnamed protein product [Adineta ricciae]
MNSSTDSYSDSDGSLLTYSSSSSETDDEIDLTKWTTTPTINGNSFQFVGNREVLVGKARSPIDFYNYVLPQHLVQIIVPSNERTNERIARYYNTLMALKWHDKKYVRILSTYHKNDTTIIQKHQIQIEKPTCVHEYNDTMCGVDIADQLIAAYSIPRKRLKTYYRKICMVLLDFAILNSYELYKIKTQQTSNTAMTQLQFHIALVRSLLEQNLDDNLPGHLVKRGRPSNEPTPARLISRHFPSFIPLTENKQKLARRCYVCTHPQNQINRARHESRFECTLCHVALCVDPCFRIYHTVLNF